MSVDTEHQGPEPQNNVAAAAETIASHLHPTPSYELADHPIPTGREELWRFTPLRRLRGLFEATGAGADLQWDVTKPDAVTLTEQSVDDIKTLGAHAPGDRLAAMAAEHADKVTVLEVPADTEHEDAIVVDLTGASAEDVIHGHTVVRIGAHATATVVVRHRGSATYNALTQVVIGDGATCNFVSVNDWDDDAVHTEQVSFTVGRDATVRTVAVSLGGDLVRIAETAEYTGPGGSIEQFGLYFVDAKQHIEHRLFVDHNQPRTRSNVDYRGALHGNGAHSVWIGDVLIRKNAEGIETYESNKNLLLTDGAQADSVPNLEIETGEIEGAGHASTTGRFDDEQLFYLRSRGIPENEARKLVVNGFFLDIIRRIGVEDIEKPLREAIEAELAALDHHINATQES